jgi:hypothetical protein
MADLPVSSQQLEASHVLHPGRGRLKRLVVIVDATAGSGDYFVHVVQGTKGAIPPDGALPAGATFLRAPRRVDHTSGSTDTVEMEDDVGEDGLAFEGGLAVWLSTSQATKTIAGPYMLVDADLRD